MTADSPYAAYHRLQDDAIRHAPPYPADRYSGRGIVMAAGGPIHFTGAWVVLNVLRRVHNCQLPVQLWYLGPDEMSPAMIDLLRPLGVECVDALAVRKRHPSRRLGGWECKPYAIIHSPFREVIWIDADNTPLVNPETFFEEPAYQETGAIFWPDVTSLPPRHPIWEICRVPWRHEPEWESGQIVLDKARCWNALLLTMHLNEWSDVYYQHVLGDKETFHMAWRMLDQSHAMPARAPRQALGRWPHAPAKDGGTLTLFQHDLHGREVFHHRSGIAKWSLYADHLAFEGFPYEAFSLEALAELRERWDGRPHPPPAPALPARTADEIVAAGLFRYVRRGIDERTLELLPDGVVGQGAGAAERSWRFDSQGPAGGPSLVLSGVHGDICRLSLDADGVWRGRWLLFERMPVEVIPLGRSVAGSVPPTRAGAAFFPAAPAVKPTLLYISPVVPALTGNGLAMRAGAVLLRLAEQYAVTLVVVRRYLSPDLDVAPIFAERCRRVLVVAEVAEAEASLGDLRFAVLHVFRLAMLPAAERFKPRAGAWHLDLDDIESATNAQLADIAALHGDEALVRQYRVAATVTAPLEQQVLDEFQRVYVCSQRDRALLAGRGSAEIVVLPNVVPVQGPIPPPPPVVLGVPSPIRASSAPMAPAEADAMPDPGAAPSVPRSERDAAASPVAAGGQPFTLLFVGTLGYLPNADGVRWFCDAVLPHLREAASVPFRVVIVGYGADQSVRALAAHPEVDVAGAVPVLAPYYRDAHAVIVPLRGGGGTRIKVLEAFSYRRPVVSTGVGAEGIDAAPDEHLLIADAPADFAAACAHLMTDAALGARLATAAHDLFLRRYAPAAVHLDA